MNAHHRHAAALERIACWRALERRAADRSERARAVFEARGQLLPRERVGLLLDAGSPFLALCNLAGLLQDQEDPAASLPGAGVVAGIGFASGVRCMVAASDCGIEGGAGQPMGPAKILRLQEIALAHKLPFVHLVEGAGAHPTRLSAAGIPVITVRHGFETVEAAGMPARSDVLITVRQASTAGDYLAQDDRHAIGIARAVLARSGWQQPARKLESDPRREDLLALLPAGVGEPADLRAILPRLADAGTLLEFQAGRAAAVVCAQGGLAGHHVGFVGDQGPVDAAAAGKATHFMRWMDKLGHPLVFLRNTAFLDAGGCDALRRAAAKATVPQLTIRCGGSQGADGMGGRAGTPRFAFSWPAADAFAASARLLDDGIIDPRDTRAVLAFCLATIAEGEARRLRPEPP